MVVFRSPLLKTNLWWSEIKNESVESYEQGKKYLEKHGFTITAVVIDGKRGVRQLFEPIPVQMCQYHQVKIVNRYLTLNPRLEASKELQKIVYTLVKSTEYEFTNKLQSWYEKWETFLKERTVDEYTNKWHYTHKKLRSAYRSLKTNLPILFTYQKYPELNIPNTNNSLEGFFNSLKSYVNIYRGLSNKRRRKVAQEVIRGRK